MDVIPASLMELNQRIPTEGEGRNVTSSTIKAQEKQNLGFLKSLQNHRSLSMSSPNPGISLAINSQAAAALEMLNPENTDLHRKNISCVIQSSLKITTTLL